MEVTQASFDLQMEFDSRFSQFGADNWVQSGEWTDLSSSGLNEELPTQDRLRDLNDEINKQFGADNWVQKSKIIHPTASPT